MKDTLTQVQQRARAYWFADGLNEIVGGTFAALLGALILLQTSLQSAQADILSTVTNMLLLAGAVSIPLLLRWMKERITYPHSGYVAYPELKPAERLKRGAPAILLALVLAVLIAGSILASPITRLWAMVCLVWMPSLMGVLVGAGIFRSARETGLTRQAWLGGLSILTALWLGWRSFPLMNLLTPALTAGRITEPMPMQTAAVMQTLMAAMYANVAFLLIIVGGAALILGVVAHVRYLKETHNVEPA
jgi:hypothetical protein